MQPQQGQQQPQRQHSRNNSGGMKQKFDSLNMDNENSNNISKSFS